MESREAYVRYYQEAHKEGYGFKLGMAVSLLLHAGLIGAMVWYSEGPKVDPMQNAIVVSLAGSPMSATSGKKRKASVKRSTKSTPTKPKDKKPKPRKPKPKKSADAVGLNSKSSKKPKPRPTNQVADDSPSSSTPKTDLGGLGGADDSGIAFDISSSNRNVEFEDIEFIDYFRTIVNEVSQRWSKGSLDGGLASVRFKIRRDGSIFGAELAESSGRAYLDGPAMRAVMGARLPPLPQGYLGEVMVVRINFRYGE